jgi:hypothetical protein
LKGQPVFFEEIIQNKPQQQVMTMREQRLYIHVLLQY